MGNTNTAYTFLVGGGISIFAYLFGGFDNLILSLAILMFVDFISGLMVAGKLGYEQTQRFKKTGIKEQAKEGISSHRAFLGLLKKSGMILAIVVAVQLDILMGNAGDFMRNALILSFVGMEGISFIENMNKLGLALPNQFADLFSQITQNNSKPPKKENK